MRLTIVFYPVLLLSLLLGVGCSTAPTTSPEVTVGQPDYGGAEPAPEPAPPKPQPPTDTSPYAQLLQQADDARAAGDYDKALALLERAQRIDPDSADIYLSMAITHKARGDLGQARATAERGLLYCSGSTQCDLLRSYTR